MTGFNMPPGCSPQDIPGNRPEDGTWEEAWDWACARIDQEGLTPEEFRRAILVGVAAIKAEQEAVQDIWKDGWHEGRVDAFEEMQR